MAGRFIPDSIHVCVEHEVYFDAPEHHGCTECALRATVARLERELEQCRAELEYERSRR